MAGMTLKVIEKDLTGFNGEAWLIQDDLTEQYYVVSRANTFDRGDETMVFASNEEGIVTDWSDKYAGYGEDHETAIANFGSVLAGDVHYDGWENIRKNGKGLNDQLMLALHDVTSGDTGGDTD